MNEPDQGSTSYSFNSTSLDQSSFSSSFQRVKRTVLSKTIPKPLATSSATRSSKSRISITKIDKNKDQKEVDLYKSDDSDVSNEVKFNAKRGKKLFVVESDDDATSSETPQSAKKPKTKINNI